MIEAGVYEHGRARCVVQADPSGHTTRMWLLIRINDRDMYVTMDDGSPLMRVLDEAVQLTDDEAFAAWTMQDDIADVMTDIFGAMAKALGMGNDTKVAHEIGVLQGENNILKKMFFDAQQEQRRTNDLRGAYQQLQFDLNTGGGTAAMWKAVNEERASQQLKAATLV